MMSRRVLILSLSVLSLAGCDSVKDQMGLSRRQPDEFAVMTRAPLEMPPENDTTLPLPRPGAQRPQEATAETSAQTAILGRTATTSSQQSAAEDALLQRAGAAQANPDIRAQIEREAVTEANKNRPVYKKILNIGRDSENDASVVDAQAEYERIQATRKAGQPITTGVTPSHND